MATCSSWLLREVDDGDTGRDELRKKAHMAESGLTGSRRVVTAPVLDEDVDEATVEEEADCSWTWVEVVDTCELKCERLPAMRKSISELRRLPPPFGSRKRRGDS